MGKVRTYVTVQCRQCGAQWEKRADGLAEWSGLCKSCTQRRNTVERFWGRLSNQDDGCWAWTGTILSNGYGQLLFEGHRWQAHRLAYVLTYGPIPDDKIVMHKCDTRACCRPDHLVLGTNKDNTQDMIQKGRTSHGAAHWYHRFPERIIRGEAHGGAQLSDAHVREIRALWQAGSISQSELARRYGVSHTHINRIIRGLSRTSH